MASFPSSWVLDAGANHKADPAPAPLPAARVQSPAPAAPAPAPAPALVSTSGAAPVFTPGTTMSGADAFPPTAPPFRLAHPAVTAKLPAGPPPYLATFPSSWLLPPSAARTTTQINRPNMPTAFAQTASISQSPAIMTPSTQSSAWVSPSFYNNSRKRHPAELYPPQGKRIASSPFVLPPRPPPTMLTQGRSRATTAWLQSLQMPQVVQQSLVSGASGGTTVGDRDGTESEYSLLGDVAQSETDGACSVYSFSVFDGVEN